MSNYSKELVKKVSILNLCTKAEAKLMLQNPENAWMRNLENLDMSKDSLPQPKQDVKVRSVWTVSGLRGSTW